jgi:hypothetical protein
MGIDTSNEGKKCGLLHSFLFYGVNKTNGDKKLSISVRFHADATCFFKDFIFSVFFYFFGALEL